MPLGCSLTDATSFIFPSCHQEARRPVPAPARASPRPRTRPLPGPARPPSPLPRRLPRMRRRPRPRPRQPPAREHPRRSRPSGAAEPPQRTSYAAVDRSLPRHRYAHVPSSHRNNIAIVFLVFIGFTKRFAKQLNLTLNRSTPSIHSPQSSPSRASARSPRPPPTEEAVSSPSRAPSPSPDRSEARISKTRKTPWRGPSIERNPTRLLESLYRRPTSAASPRLTRTRAPTTDGASPHR